MVKNDSLHRIVITQDVLDAADREARRERSKTFYRIAGTLVRSARRFFDAITGAGRPAEAKPFNLAAKSDIHLDYGDVFEIEPALGSKLSSVNGTLWVTQNRVDIIIEAGDAFMFQNSGPALVTPLRGNADVRLCESSAPLSIAA